MAYPLRVCFDGAVYHVTARGDNREATFLDQQDYRQYLQLLRQRKDSFRFLLHAYALMPNHVHLLIEPAPGTVISRIMQGLTIAYTKYFNKRYERVGHVFQGRFRSRLVETEGYLLVASRYIHLNPVRARLVEHPAKWPWSSYAAYWQGRSVLKLVDVELVLRLMHQPAGSQREAYCEFVELPTPREIADQEVRLAEIDI